MVAIFKDLRVLDNQIESYDFTVVRPISGMHTLVFDGLTVEGNRKPSVRSHTLA